MGLRGKKSRLRNFEKNAQNAVEARSRGKGVRTITRLKKKLQIAFGPKSRRLAFKTKREDLNLLLGYQKWLQAESVHGAVILKNFTLEPLKGTIVRGVGVSQYYNKPTIKHLKEYLKMKRTGALQNKFLSEKEYFLCKSFMKRSENKEITKAQLDKVEEELKNIAYRSTIYDFIEHIPWASNTVVHGTNKDGTLRITLIDI